MKTMTLEDKLRILLDTLRDNVHVNRQKASYENERSMKSWLDGRASAYANAAQWLEKIIA